MDFKRFISLRKELHKIPEKSGNEFDTASKITEALEQLSPDKLFKGIGGTGILAGFFGQQSKPVNNILFRAELDAIAVRELNDCDYVSTNEGLMHGCGHDGHMSILLALATKLSMNRPGNVNVWLLFQPAEETGEGAGRVMKDSRFAKLNFENAFALHNLPGFEEKKILVKEDVFACASMGIEIEFRGSSSHAAYPEQGMNPANIIAELITQAEPFFKEFRKKNDHNKAVCTFIKLGEEAYGISPGTGKIGFTLRSPDDNSLQAAVQNLEEFTKRHSRSFEGSMNFSMVEPFPATVNSGNGVDIIRMAAAEAGMLVQELNEPFPWSEDFGAFIEVCPITLFGLGAGEHSPPLHSEKYDFNDRLIETGFQVFWQVIKSYNQS